MTILVLGATGNTGSLVVAGLKQQGATFRALVRSEAKAQQLGLSDQQTAIGDFDNLDNLEQAMKGVDRVYLSMPVSLHNQRWVENVIAAAKASGVAHIVKLSGMHASEDAGSEVIRTHALTDELLKDSGLAYTLIQPNSFYQNLYGALPTIQTNGEFYLPLADAAQSVVDIRDVADVVVASLTEDGHAGQTYVLTGPEALSFDEQAARISALANKPVNYVAVPREAAEQAMAGAGMDAWLAAALAEIMAWFGTGRYTEVTGDVEKVLGRAPRHFDDFAGEFAKAI